MSLSLRAARRGRGRDRPHRLPAEFPYLGAFLYLPPSWDRDQGRNCEVLVMTVFPPFLRRSCIQYVVSDVNIILVLALWCICDKIGSCLDDYWFQIWRSLSTLINDLWLMNPDRRMILLSFFLKTHRALPRAHRA